MSRVLWQETCLEETADSQQTRTLAESDQAAPGRHVRLGVGGAEGGGEGRGGGGGDGPGQTGHLLSARGGERGWCWRLGERRRDDGLDLVTQSRHPLGPVGVPALSAFN